jgi:hypothetical protein
MRLADLLSVAGKARENPALISAHLVLKSASPAGRVKIQ